LPCLSETFVFIVDDFQWPTVRKATYKIIADLEKIGSISKVCDFVLDSETPPKEYWPDGWLDGYTNYVGTWRNGIYVGLFQKKSNRIELEDKVTIGFIKHNPEMFDRFLGPSLQKIRRKQS
jgi:hypothetical protein